MTVSFGSFLSQLSDPALQCVVFLTLCVILVNGWTDAPNAIATAVSTRALPFHTAVRLAALCNLLGVTVMTAFNASVAESIYTIADFGGDVRGALCALCAALCAIVLWSAAAWVFGIPTSESHALVAGITGAAAARPGGLSNVQGDTWFRVVLGLVVSVILGFLLGRLCGFPAVRDSRRSPAFYRRAQTGGAAAMAFFHGAQDGQKFMGVFLLGVALAQGRRDAETFLVPMWLMVLCALTMALGTSLGGKRIIDTVGHEMVCLDARRGFAADCAGALCLLLCTLCGLPVSTTHTKTAAMLGVGSSVPGHPPDWKIARSIVLTWLLTFPGCGVIGYFMARIFLSFL